MKNKSYQGHTGKASYFSKDKALSAARNIKNMKMYVYSCDYELGNHYHLSHLSPKEFEERKSNLGKLGINAE